MRITWQEIRKWRSCYSDEQLQQIFGEDGLTPLEIRNLADIPLTHRLHALVRVLVYRSKTPVTDYTGWCMLRAHYHTADKAFAAAYATADASYVARVAAANAANDAYAAAPYAPYAAYDADFANAYAADAGYEAARAAAAARVATAIAAYDLYDANYGYNVASAAAANDERSQHLDYLVELIGE